MNRSLSLETIPAGELGINRTFPAISVLALERVYPPTSAKPISGEPSPAVVQMKFSALNRGITEGWCAVEEAFLGATVKSKRGGEGDNHRHRLAQNKA